MKFKTKSLKSVKKLSLALVCCLALSGTAVYADGEADEGPDVVFEYCGIANVPDRMGPDGYNYRSLQNDLFYIEYPGSWVFGTSNVSPIMFYKGAESSGNRSEFQTFEDERLIGDEDTIDQYVRNGGIDSYIRQVAGDTTGCEFKLQDKEYSILVYSLNKDSETVASIIVWTIFGKVDIRSERSTVTVDLTNDYGSICMFPIWDSTDFSSAEAISAYISSGGLNTRLSNYASDLVWEIAPYDTANHNYVLCKDESGSTNFAAYIPVTPPHMKKWIVVFETSKMSQTGFNAYGIQEEIMKTFKVLK